MIVFFGVFNETVVTWQQEGLVQTKFLIVFFRRSIFKLPTAPEELSYNLFRGITWFIALHHEIGKHFYLNTLSTRPFPRFGSVYSQRVQFCKTKTFPRLYAVFLNVRQSLVRIVNNASLVRPDVVHHKLRHVPSSDWLSLLQFRK